MDGQVSSAFPYPSKMGAEAHSLQECRGIHGYQGACNLDKASTATAPDG